jgi:quercetin dioxygenase-like cupin family protein
MAGHPGFRRVWMPFRSKEKFAMKRFTIIVPVLLIVSLLSVAPGLLSAHQEADLPTDVQGVGGGPIAGGIPEAASDHTLWLRKGVFEPGGYVGVHHHPGALIIYVESGSLYYIVLEGEVIVYRQPMAETPGPTETYGPGEEFTLEAGDAWFEQNVVHVTENRGTEDAVVWLSALAVTDEELTILHEEGTPESH